MTAKPDCPRHGQLCAYTATEPGRCPVCHSTWARIESCPCPGCQGRAHHLAGHKHADEARARNAARRAARADALLVGQEVTRDE